MVNWWKPLQGTACEQSANPARLTRRLWALRVAAGATALVLAACGGGGSSADRGPTNITLASADANGIYWDANESRLYLTDDTSNAILTWDGDGKTTFSNYVNLPALQPPATNTQVSIGELTRTSNGTFYTTRFGFGNAGTVIAVSPGRVASNLTGLDPVRRRIAVTVTGAGEIIDNWFVTPPSPNATSTGGAISLLTVNGGAATERELVTGLSKPVGSVVVGRTLYVSDQTTGRLTSFPLDALLTAPRTASQGTLVASFTADLSVPSNDNIDLTTAGADGNLYLGGRGGKLYRVTPAGVVTQLDSLNTTANAGLLQIRGIAVDNVNRRLFVVVHSTDTARAPNALRIVPLN